MNTFKTLAFLVILLFLSSMTSSMKFKKNLSLKTKNGVALKKTLITKSNKKITNLKKDNDHKDKPKVEDILVYDAYPGNRFGHVAIVSKVSDDEIELVQQNIGKKTRIKIPLVNFYQYWTVADYNILGWLRKE